MSTIKKSGDLIYPNKNGYFVSTIDQSQPLQKEWLRPLQFCVQEIQKQLPNLINSIYVRGSVARGVAIAGVSDIDLVIILKNKLPVLYERGWVRQFVKQLRSKYPQVDDVEFETTSLSSLLNLESHLGIRVLIELQGKLLAGDDVIKRLPPIKPDSSSFVHIPTFSIFQERVKSTLATKDVFLPAYISWVAKRYIRTGFELCIEREKVFTRDLYPCYKVFSKYYPGKEYEMCKVLEQAISPTWTKSQLLGCIYALGEWLNLEVKKKYPRYI